MRRGVITVAVVIAFTFTVLPQSDHAASLYATSRARPSVDADAMAADVAAADVAAVDVAVARKAARVLLSERSRDDVYHPRGHRPAKRSGEPDGIPGSLDATSRVRPNVVADEMAADVAAADVKSVDVAAVNVVAGSAEARVWLSAPSYADVYHPRGHKPAKRSAEPDGIPGYVYGTSRVRPSVVADAAAAASAAARERRRTELSRDDEPRTRGRRRARRAAAPDGILGLSNTRGVRRRSATTNEAAGGGGMFGDVNISAILDSLSVSYDKRVRPNYGGPPVDVGVTMYVLSISSLSEVKMDFTLDFYFRQFWTDPRLAYKKRPGVETLSVGSEFIRNIWVPDTFFVNEKQSYFHIATTSNEFIRIHHSGSITRSIRLTITASCPMDLQYFPMDRQLCNIEIESFGYTMRDIRYKWNEGPNSVGVSSEVSLPQFKVLGHRQRAMEISLTTGNYSRLACEIQFVRSMGYYLIQIYIPSGLIVIISWVSFWLNRNATPARVSLGVTTVLTMTTLMSSTNAALPKISYVKSIDVYLGTCFVMVFASLLEYATVGYMAKRIQMRKQRFTAAQKLAEQKKVVVDPVAPAPAILEPVPPPRGSNLSRSQRSQGSHGSHGFPHHEMQRGHHAVPIGQPQPPSRSSEVRYKVHDPKAYSKGGTLENTINGARAPPPPPVVAPAATGSSDEEMGAILYSKGINKLLGTTPSDIDKYSRIVFPVCFVCFNLMYWIIYLHVSDVVADDLVLLGEVN